MRPHDQAVSSTSELPNSVVVFADAEVPSIVSMFQMLGDADSLRTSDTKRPKLTSVASTAAVGDRYFVLAEYMSLYLRGRKVAGSSAVASLRSFNVFDYLNSVFYRAEPASREVIPLRSVFNDCH